MMDMYFYLKRFLIRYILKYTTLIHIHIVSQIVDKLPVFK